MCPSQTSHQPPAPGPKIASSRCLAGFPGAGYQMSGQLSGALGLTAFTAAAVVLALAVVWIRAWRTVSPAPAAVGDDVTVDAHPAMQPHSVGGESQPDLHDHALAGAKPGESTRLPLQIR